MAQGSISKHVAGDGRVSWHVRMSTGFNPTTGRRMQQQRTFKTRREAEHGRAVWLAELDRGTAIDPSKLTVAAYLARWLDDSVKPNVRQTTYMSYELVVRARIVPTLGSVLLQKLTAMQVQKLYTDLLTGERGDGKPGVRSPRTVRYTHMVLKKALSQAVRWRLVQHNVAGEVDPPRVPRKPVEAWNDHEAQAFMQAADGDAYGALWTVALTTGMRQGELLALRWCDVDLAIGRIRVERTATRTTTGYEYGEPKTKAGRRVISLSVDCIDALQMQATVRPARPIPLEAKDRDTDLVFCSAAGTQLDQRNVVRQFDKIVKAAALRRITFHGLRHTHATLLLLNGVNVKAVSTRLGHASIQITLDTYAHVLPQMEEQAADAIQRALKRHA